MSEIWVAAIGAVAVAGATAYSANKQKQSADKANATLANAQGIHPAQLGAPTLVNAGDAQRFAIGANGGALSKDFELANQVNNFQLGQALRGYNRIQPYFNQLQAQLGKNALQMSQGQLPSDVVSSIGRAAASRGFESGFGQGANGAQGGTSLGNLNLRNLGLTSLQTSQQGNTLGMALNAQAGALAPSLFDPSSMFITPQLALAAQQFNAGALNQTAQLNAGYANAANTQNVGLQNAILQQQSNNSLAASEAAQKQYASAAQSIAGLASTINTNGTNSGGFYNTAGGAQNALSQSGSYGTGASVTNSPYGYAIRPALA
jgi:hypothetical protein